MSILSDSRKRNKVFAWISCVMAFLIPLTGWNPILLLWETDLYFSYRKSTNKKIKIFYAVAIALLAILIFSNALTRFIALVEYF